jgi:hypothetical protein
VRLSSFLQLEQYVLELFGKYSQSGGLLRKGFGEVSSLTQWPAKHLTYIIKHVKCCSTYTQLCFICVFRAFSLLCLSTPAVQQQHAIVL